MPVIEEKSDAKSLNWTLKATVTLDCQIRGQAGMNIYWKRDANTIQETSFEKIDTKYPQEAVISAVAKTQINITYKNERDVYDNFNCTSLSNNTRRLLCKSVYSCSASYQNAATSSQGDIPVIATPDIGRRTVITLYKCLNYCVNS